VEELMKTSSLISIKKEKKRSFIIKGDEAKGIFYLKKGIIVGLKHVTPSGLSISTFF
jgi:hypothetical protein